MKLKSSPLLRRLRAAVKRISPAAIELAEAIAELAEPPMREVKSADRLTEFLSASGFGVTRPYRRLPTAFRAVAGAGRPTIAILAEYDALPDCGRRRGQWGHGCGHNLLGAGAAAAGAVAAEVLAAAGAAGRVIVLGCPAEEALAGKVFMAAQGAFRGLDAVLAWHPGSGNNAKVAGGLALDSVRFVFRGRTAHAGGAPEKGRSALDAAVLTDVAVNYLREHIEEASRIHSVVSDGGTAPNVVPDRAEIWYYIRGKDRKRVDDLRRRVALCARGAAIATETRQRMFVDSSITERIANQTIGDLLQGLLARCRPPRFTPAEGRAAAKVLPGKKYATGIEPIPTDVGRGSSDEDNVSWFAPLGCLVTACAPKGAVGHHRDYAALVRLPGAHRGMLKAVEVLAAAAIELAVNARLLSKATEEFRKNRRGKKYDLPMTSTVPPLNYGPRAPASPAG